MKFFTSIPVAIVALLGTVLVTNAGGTNPPPHWAFQPISRQEPPAVKNVARAQTAIDRFILARLEENGLQPAPAASRPTLIRRATLDLTGLPPTPEEVDAFVADKSTNAFEKVVGRLLASPRYGERWGRHWLDVARYADSNGMDENLAYGSAWRYRDYVVTAFNSDKPYDRFVREQLAGDLLPATGTANDSERLIATGFLTIGPKMLAEDDPVKMEMDIIDEQLDTTSRAFMGLTVGCGRCHDHKYDPVPMNDYYAMAGIFKSTRTMENFKVVARWQERPLGTPEEIEKNAAQRKRIDEAAQRVKTLISEANTNLLREARTRAADYIAAAEEQRALDRWLAEARPLGNGVKTNSGNGFVIVEAEDFQRAENVVSTKTGYGEGIGVIYGPGGKLNAAEYDVAVVKAGWHRVEIRYAAAAERPVKFILNGTLAKQDVAAGTTGSWNPDTQTWELIGVYRLEAGTNIVRIERADCVPHIDRLLFAPVSEAEAAKFAAASGPEAGRRATLIPGFVKQWAAYLKKTEKQPAAEGEALQKLINDPKGPFELLKNAESHFPESVRSDLSQAREKQTALEQSLPTLPEAMSVAEGTVRDLKIHKRGSHLTLGDDTVRGVLKSIGAPLPPPLGTNSSGRLQLAEWLVHPGHPLTARVMVNRIWLWHFGEGLVRSPDNFGKLGDNPTHPELLDWLARRFIESGWSVKEMHRLIMASTVYQQGSQRALAGGRSSVISGQSSEVSQSAITDSQGGSPSTEHGKPNADHSRQTAAPDPDNRLLSHFPRRRLEVEAIRDSILFVSGGLEPAMGGTLLTVSNRVYVTSTANKLDASLFDKPVRSLYLPVVRSALYDVFQVFDFADPSTLNGRRDQTTVAPQALFMMNSRLVADAARRIATNLVAEKNLDDAARVGRLYRIAYGRSPTDAERVSALNYMKRHTELTAARDAKSGEGPLKAWQSFCRTVMAANEFIYMD